VLSPPPLWLYTCTIITGVPNELHEIHTRIPIILPEKHRDACYPLKPEKKFRSASPAGDVRKKESHLIQKSMQQSGYIYSNHCIETYEEIKERFHFVTYQTGDPDVVRV
jgi:hypothetical protein